MSQQPRDGHKEVDKVLDTLATQSDNTLIRPAQPMPAQPMPPSMIHPTPFPHHPSCIPSLLHHTNTTNNNHINHHHINTQLINRNANRFNMDTDHLDIDSLLPDPSITTNINDTHHINNNMNLHPPIHSDELSTSFLSDVSSLSSATLKQDFSNLSFGLLLSKSPSPCPSPSNTTTSTNPPNLALQPLFLTSSKSITTPNIESASHNLAPAPPPLISPPPVLSTFAPFTIFPTTPNSADLLAFLDNSHMFDFNDNNNNNNNIAINTTNKASRNNVHKTSKQMQTEKGESKYNHKKIQKNILNNNNNNNNKVKHSQNIPKNKKVTVKINMDNNNGSKPSSAASTSSSPDANNVNDQYDASDASIRSITGKFLTMYYSTLHSNPEDLKRFYHVNAEIDRSCCGMIIDDANKYAVKNWTNKKDDADDTEKNDKNDEMCRKLSVLRYATFVDVEKVIHQKSLNNSILIHAICSMKFEHNASKRFQQIFYINKQKGFWLIRNDILIFLDVLNSPDFYIKNNQKENEKNVINSSYRLNKSASYSNITTSSVMTPKQSAVNKRMVNKFYHDSSYQMFDNNLAIFIRGIPQTITHSKLCGILRTNFLKFTKNQQKKVNIMIDYIDVNYHKQFAFIYLGNQETLDIALQMKSINVNGYICRIERKRSHNGPRKFPPKRQHIPAPKFQQHQ